MSNPSSSRRPPPAQQRQSEENLTWLDFLRSAGGTVPTDNGTNNTNSSSSADRKRRAGSSPERRGYPYSAYAPNAGMTGRRSPGMSTGMSGNSRDTAIDLTSPPLRPQQPPRPQLQDRNMGSQDGVRSGVRTTSSGVVRRSSMEPRRESDITLPLWQPDSEVTKCPVCQTEFHFFYRKHHCRKCGRVVCAACSPHRITIPRQYIVQPPNSLEEPPSPVNRNLGGGEVVRVCNPCVPDPWTPDTASDAAQRPSQPDPSRSRGSHPQNIVPDHHRYPTGSAGRLRSHSHQPVHNHSTESYPDYVQRQLRGPSQSHRPHRYTHSSGGPFPGMSPSRGHMPPPDQSRTGQGFPSMPQNQIPQPVPPPPSRQTRPRREIREEDECPVCGLELPPGEAVRESHIQECITLRFSSTPSSSSLPPHPPSAPPPRTSSISSPPNNAPTTASTNPSAASTPPNSRPRTTSYRPRGMALYRATEKDCMTEDGEPQECVICFEEFQPGDEMGRMECLCKFHRACIRRWWDTKGTGSCPTHQLHD